VCPQVAPDFAAAVPFVADETAGMELRATTVRPLHGTLGHERLKHRGFVLLPRGQEQRHELALPFGTEVDFGAEAPLAPA